MVAIDEDALAKAEQYVAHKQSADGSWPLQYDWEKQYDLQAVSQTAYIARVMAESGERPGSGGNSSPVVAALKFLEPRIAKLDDPYAVANFALTAEGVGRHEEALEAIRRLRALAHTSQIGTYWNLEHNTPFYEWGSTGRLQTTALAARALQVVAHSDKDRVLLNGALQFLLSGKDRYGVWDSGQTTVGVLDYLISVAGTQAGAPGLLFFSVNGQPSQKVALPAGKALVNPIVVDVSALLQAGQNFIVIRPDERVSRGTVQLVSTFYVPWKAEEKGTDNAEADQKPGDSDLLRLFVHFDKTTASVGDSVTCRVEAERIGFHGYGMMLAEIGLPPGADVDRASLEKAMEQAGWGFEQYDILPDRVVAYIWPSWKAGPTTFEFSFKPRLGMTAKTAPDILFDYYNPEARVELAPSTFVVAEK